MKRREVLKTLAVAGTSLMLEPGMFRAWSAQQAAPDPTVTRVLVMFKCHFDAGFINTQHYVVQEYFTRFFPRAIEVARLENSQGKRRYVWTTGSWLLYEYLERASAGDRKTMEQAIARGDIAWHALPFNWQTEMLSPSMIEGSLALARSLDRRFGTVTTGAKMTDVPGHTRGIIPPLANGGVTFLEIGVNGGSTPAVLPPIFLWQDPSGAKLAMMYHAEYGGIARIPGSTVALATVVRGDNSGPHTPAEIASIHADLAARFPRADIEATNLSVMANALAPFHSQLPVVSREVGDTWIYGIASDPLKVARYRELSRLRDAWIGKGIIKAGDDTDVAMLRRVLLEPEHTWGTDTKTWLDFVNYTPTALAHMLDTKNYKVVEYSWQEKRQDIFDGVAALPAGLRDEASQAIASVAPTRPRIEGAIHPENQTIETSHFLIEISPASGAITRLRNKSTGREWARAGNPIALLTYQTLSHADYQAFLASYVTTKESWAAKDFGKPNIEKYGARSQEWHPASAEVYVRKTADADEIVASLQFNDREALESGRAAFPRKAYVKLTLPHDQPVIHIELSWFEKPATRLPEALWLTFNPVFEDTEGWVLDKCGESISPFDVVESGNRHMHSLQKGFSYKSGDGSFAVDTIDAPLVALGERTALHFSNSQPDLKKGIHSCIFNNAWGTNYIMWYGEDVSARYVLSAT